MTAPTSVEEYLAALPEKSRGTLEKLRKTIRAAAPGATEAIAYQMPRSRITVDSLFHTPRSRTLQPLPGHRSGSQGIR
jgi:uncharacterized protein YdhG (YjbR/CyaY superfamily)